MYIPIVAFFASDITESNVNFNSGFLAETNTNDFDNFLRFPRRDELSLVQPAIQSLCKSRIKFIESPRVQENKARELKS